MAPANGQVTTNRLIMKIKLIHPTLSRTFLQSLDQGQQIMTHTSNLLPQRPVAPNSSVGLGVLLLMLLMSPPPAAQARPTLINFDDVADGTIINTHYPGVTLSSRTSGNVFARAAETFAVSSLNVVSTSASGFA